MHEILVAMQAGSLSDPAIAGFDANRFRKVAGRKGPRVQESIVGLGKPLAEKIVRQMTVITGRDIVMA